MWLYLGCFLTYQFHLSSISRNGNEQSILVEETFKECNVCSKAIKDDEYICESCNLAFHENFMGKDSSCLGCV
jgi:predicted amidophosphoribosyltransferase